MMPGISSSVSARGSETSAKVPPTKVLPLARIAEGAPGACSVLEVQPTCLGLLQCLGDHLSLSFHTGSKIANLACAIVVDCRSQDHCANWIPGRESILESSKDDNAHSASEYCPRRASIERAAMAVA